MRGRSKSMCVSSSKLLEESESESDTSEDEKYQADAETSLSAESNVNIIRKVWEQLPKNDTLPFDKRLEQIDWDRVSDVMSPEKTRQRFKNAITTVRTYRTLGEILKDVEKRILIEVGLPKRPLPAFSLFVGERKEYIKKRLEPNMGPGSFSKVAAEEFKNLSEKEKDTYREKSKLLKKQYKDVVAKFNLEDKFTKKAKEPKPPPDNLITYYHNQLKKAGSNVSLKEARTHLHDLSKKEKLSVILKYLGVKKGRKLNLEQYQKAQKVLSKDDMAIVDDYEGKPKTMSAYNAFMKDFLATNKNSSGLPWSEFFKIGVNQWKELPAEKKDRYENASAKRKIKFKEEYNDYISSLPPDRQEYENSKSKGKQKNAKENATPKKNGSINSLDAKPKKSKSKKSLPVTEEIDDQTATSPSKLKGKKRKEKSKFKEEAETCLPEEASPKKKKRKVSKNFAEDEQNLSFETSQVKIESRNSSFSSETNKKEQKGGKKEWPKKPPSSLRKFYASKIYKGPSSEAKTYFDALSKKEKKVLAARYEKSKKEYLEAVETHIKSLSKEEVLHLQKHGVPTSEDTDDSDSSEDSYSDSSD